MKVRVKVQERGCRSHWVVVVDVVPEKACPVLYAAREAMPQAQCRRPSLGIPQSGEDKKTRW